MKNFLKNWGFRRILYLAIGIWMILQSVYDGAWFFSIFGIYFASMAIFKFGCAAGNCGTNGCEIDKYPIKS